MKILFCSGIKESHQMFNDVTVAELKNKDCEVEVLWVKSPRELEEFLESGKSSTVDVLVSESDFRHIGLSDHGRKEEETVAAGIVDMIGRLAPHIKTVFLGEYYSAHQQQMEARNRDRWSISLSYRINRVVKQKTIY